MRSKTEMKSGSRRGVVLRLVKTLFSFYPVMLPIAIVGIIFDAVISAIPSVFMQNVLAVVEDTFQSGDWSAASGAILGLVAILVVLYVLSLIAGFTHTQLMAIITQGSLAKMREKMFDGM